PKQAIQSVGYFDEQLPRLQDLDFFVRFLKDGGVIRSCATDLSLCLYNKSDWGRDAAQIRACNSYLLDKHRAIYETFGDEFVSSCVFQMDLLAARYAFNNRQWLLAGRYAAGAFRRHPLTMTRRVTTRLSRWAKRRLIPDKAE